MQVIPIVVGSLEANSYIVHDGKGNGVIIDPGADPDMILAKVEDEQLNIDEIVLTHGHFDHIGATDAIEQKTGAKVSIHREDEEMLLDSHKNLSYALGVNYKVDGAARLLEEGDIVRVGEHSLDIIHTPGHSKGGICLLFQDKFIFTGDTLFMNSIGRTDLHGGDYNTLIESINEKIMPLDDNVIIYSGHGPESTVGHERLQNPYLR